MHVKVLSSIRIRYGLQSSQMLGCKHVSSSTSHHSMRKPSVVGGQDLSSVKLSGAQQKILQGQKNISRAEMKLGRSEQMSLGVRLPLVHTMSHESSPQTNTFSLFSLEILSGRTAQPSRSSPHCSKTIHLHLKDPQSWEPVASLGF